MTPESILLAVGLAATALLAWHFGLYPVATGLVWLTRDRAPPETDDLPAVTVIVPSYNEATVIDRRVRDLARVDYPADRFEVVFVDSGSDDGTLDVLRDALAAVELPRTRIVAQDERRGKAAAINAGIDVASGDVVLVTDANTRYERGTVRALAAHFSDPEVGAVTGSHAIPRAEEGLTASNQLYYDLEDLKARGEALLDSTCQLYGEISAWRPELARAATDNLAEDLELSVQIRRAGYRIEYEPAARAYEGEPTTDEEQVVSKKRQFVGLLQTAARHWRFLAVPRDAYRALIFPSRKLLQVCSPLLVALVGAALLGLLALGAWPLAAAYLAVNVVGAVATAGCVLAVRARVAEDAGGDSTGSLGILPAALRFFLLMEYTIVLAWRDFVAGRYSVLWEKSTTDR